MQEQEIISIVRRLQKTKCETQTLEVKKAEKGAPERLYDTLSSFSNQDEGGVILFGFDESNGFVQVELFNAQALIKSIEEQCKQMTPVVRPQITVAEIDGKTVVVAEIPGVEISERPVYYNGKGKVRGSFIRVGEADEAMSDYEVYAFEAFRKKIQDDLRIIDSKTINDLHPLKLKKFLLSASENKPRLAALPSDDILELLGVTKEGSLTLAGLLTLGVYPQSAFPFLSITAVVVPGTEYGETGTNGERFVANRRFEGTIGEMLDDALIFVARNMRKKTIIDGNGRRADKEEYPKRAVREAILNALMHRDYSVNTDGIPIQIRMYNDRLEIISPGGLYGRVTLQSLGKGQPDTRNRTIATILEVLDVAENRYSGIPTIRRECELSSLPEPKFEIIRGEFTVTFYNEQAVIEEKNIAIEDKLIEFCKTPRLRAEIVKFLGKTQYYALRTYIDPLVAEGKLQLTLPDVPRSKHQKYVSRGENL